MTRILSTAAIRLQESLRALSYAPFYAGARRLREGYERLGASLVSGHFMAERLTPFA